MKEKIIYFDNLTSMEDIERMLISFIGNMVEKKRKTMYDGGSYKGVILSLHDKCALKITESNGLDSHHHTEINLLRYLNGEEDFLEVENMINPFLYSRDAKTIREEGLPIRFSSAIDGLLVELDIPHNYNEFQLTNLILIIKFIRELRERNHYNRVEISMSIPNERNKIHCNDLDKEKYDEIIGVINNLLSNIVKHTK